MKKWELAVLMLGIGVAVGVATIILLKNAPTSVAGSLSYVPVQTNEEVWEWTDWKGRSRKIAVHRKVERSV